MKLLFLIFSLLFSLSACCESLPEDGQPIPTRICSANVTVSRKASCSLLIREKVSFPFASSSNKFLRQIPILAVQNLTDVNATAGGDQVDVNVKERTNGVQILELETPTTMKPVEYVLSYTLSGGVMRATREGCGVIPEDDLPLQGRVWRWASGDWGYEVSSLQVTFRSVNARRKLTASGTEFESEELQNGWLRVRVDARDIKHSRGLLQIYATEKRSGKACSSPLQCLFIVDPNNADNGFFSFNAWWHWFIVAAIAGFGIGVLLAICQCCWRKCCGHGHGSGPTHQTYPVYSHGDESPTFEIEVRNEAPVYSGMDMDERRARYGVSDSERAKRKRKEAERRRQQQQQMQQQMQQMQRDQSRRREEANRAERRAGQQRASQQRAAQQRAAQQRAAQQRAAAQRAAQRRRY